MYTQWFDFSGYESYVINNKMSHWLGVAVKGTEVEIRYTLLDFDVNDVSQSALHSTLQSMATGVRTFLAKHV
jgi:hypothetical protein